MKTTSKYMSSPIDKSRTGKEHSRRIKIPESEHLYIRERHKRGEGIRALARTYGVDKRLIQFIIYPERKQLNLELRKKRGGWKRYYSKDKHKANMREHRAYKESLLKKQLIK